VILQLLLVAIAAVDHFKQEVISGVLRWPAGDLGLRKHAWQVVADLHQITFGKTADKQVGLKRIFDRLTQEEQDG
jgi:hypothetical protein